MIPVGSIVRYKKEWCTPGERKYLHRVLENRVNPVTGKMTRLLIECINMQNMSFNPTEDVEECMVELAEEE
jgi:hypothetical protein